MFLFLSFNILLHNFQLSTSVKGEIYLLNDIIGILIEYIMRICRRGKLGTIGNHNSSKRHSKRNEKF